MTVQKRIASCNLLFLSAMNRLNWQLSVQKKKTLLLHVRTPRTLLLVHLSPSAPQAKYVLIPRQLLITILTFPCNWTQQMKSYRRRVNIVHDKDQKLWRRFQTDIFAKTRNVTWQCDPLLRPRCGFFFRLPAQGQRHLTIVILGPYNPTSNRDINKCSFIRGKNIGIYFVSICSRTINFYPLTLTLNFLSGCISENKILAVSRKLKLYRFRYSSSFRFRIVADDVKPDEDDSEQPNWMKYWRKRHVIDKASFESLLYIY